ncbi:MAG: site-2 protease family protein [Paracoccaceae bacterium]
MDLPRLALLDQLRLRVSTEGRRVIYLAQDTVAGRIFALPADTAAALRRMRAARRVGARDAGLDEAQAQSVFRFLHMVQSMRDGDVLKRKPFNPIFMNVPLFDVGPWQPGLRGLARAVVGWPCVWALLALGAVAAWLGIRNDWSILRVFSDIFSVEAIVTFGLMAPVLKLVHELGHVLAATAAGVRVRKAGLYLIGLYPMPFVDCTEADMTARRRDRILISLAGLITDVGIGLLAFVGWHLVDGDFARTLLGNVFMFATVNSIVFNANPLIKLDGYYAMVDAIGQRNLSTRATSTLRDLRAWIMTLGADGRPPGSGGAWAVTSYGVASFGYRIYILYVIASALMPRYLGAGAVVTAWGAAVMFLTPMLADRPARPAAGGGVRARRWLARAVLLAGLGGALVWVEAPFRTVVPVALDVTDRYQVTARSPGYVTARAPFGPAAAGEALLTLANDGLDDEIALARDEVATARRTLETVQGESASRTAAARESLGTKVSQLALLRARRDGLVVTAPADGTFLPASGLAMGSLVAPGAPFGAFFPDAGPTQLRGAFPERYIDRFAQRDQVTLRMGGAYRDLPLDAVAIRSTVTLDQQTGRRAYTLVVTLDEAPSGNVGRTGMVRLRFPPAPLWEHAAFAWTGLVANFREAQMADRQQYLD